MEKTLTAGTGSAKGTTHSFKGEPRTEFLKERERGLDTGLGLTIRSGQVRTGEEDWNSTGPVCVLV